MWDRFARPASADPAATAAHPLAILVQEHTPGLVNATVIVQFAGTVEPLALTLDGARGWWELMELECSTDIDPEQSRDPPEQTASTLNSQRHPPLVPDTLAPPAGITLPRAERWPHPDLGRALDSFDSPSIDLG